MQQTPIILILVTCIVKTINTAVPIFRDDAAKMVEVGFKKTTRRGVTKIDITKIEINWQPFAMVTDKESVDKGKFNLQLKTGDEDWKSMDLSPANRGGGKFRWIIDNILPCKDHSLKFFVESPDGEVAEYEYPILVKAASTEQIENSEDFTPNIPTNLSIDNTDDQIVLNWDNVECAASYEVLYRKIGLAEDNYQSLVTHSNSIVLSDDLEACSDHEVIVSAVTGNRFSDGVTSEFTTIPDRSSAEKLSPVFDPQVNSVRVSWQAWEKLSCIMAYSVQICTDKSDCEEAETVHRDENLPTIEYVSNSNLNPCSSYIFHLQPLYQEIEMDSISFPFRTLYPPMERATEMIQPIAAINEDQQTTVLSWSEVQCSSGYEIFWRLNIPETKWESVGTTENNNYTVTSIPCTEFIYGVKVLVDNKQSEVVEMDAPVLTPLPTNKPYMIPNLQIISTFNGSKISWYHAQCINHYEIKICPSENSDNPCKEERVEVKNHNEQNVTKQIGGLSVCTYYTLHIYPITSEHKLNTEPHNFSTLAPPPTSPADTIVHIDVVNDNINLIISPVECASSYKLYGRREHMNEELVLETSDLNITIPREKPCVNYSLILTSVVAGEESDPREVIEDISPPKNDDNSHPEIFIEELYNSTMMIVMKIPHQNRKCQVDLYNLKYKTSVMRKEKELLITPEELEYGLIKIGSLAALEKGIVIKGRLKYSEFETWSPWISTSNLVSPDDLSDEEKYSVVVPTLTSILIVAVILLIIVFFIQRKNRSQNKYEPTNWTFVEESKILRSEPSV